MCVIIACTMVSRFTRRYTPGPGITAQIAESALLGVGSSGEPTACRSAGSVRERGRCSSRHVRIAVRGGGHLILEALLLAAPAREMDGDVRGYLDRLRQHLHDLAVHLLLL